VLTAAALTSGANSSSLTASLNYSNTTYPSFAKTNSPSHPNTTSSGDTTAATTTAISYVSGSAAVASCNLAWASWLASSESWENSAVFGFSPTTTLTEIFNSTTTVYSTYKLCDGIPRAVISGNVNYTTLTGTVNAFMPPLVYSFESILSPSLVIVSIITTVTSWTLTASGFPTQTLTAGSYSSPSPTCAIDPSDCASLYVASSNAMFTGGGINLTASSPIFCETAFENFSEYPCYLYIPIVQLI